jgi:hypothetical protein
VHNIQEALDAKKGGRAAAVVRNLVKNVQKHFRYIQVRMQPEFACLLAGVAERSVQ